MQMSEKLLLLLNVNPAGSKFGLTRDEICLQLGHDWEDIKEAVGILRSFSWVNSAKRCDSQGTPTHEIEYWLTAQGNKELDRRIRMANANTDMEKVLKNRNANP